MYKLIGVFENICGQGVYSADKEQTMKALESLGSSSAECEALFDKFKIGSKEDNLTIYRFYYRDCLLTNYGKATA